MIQRLRVVSEITGIHRLEITKDSVVRYVQGDFPLMIVTNSMLYYPEGDADYFKGERIFSQANADIHLHRSTDDLSNEYDEQHYKMRNARSGKIECSCGDLHCTSLVMMDIKVKGFSKGKR